MIETRFFIRSYQLKEMEFKTDIFWVDAGLIHKLKQTALGI